MVGEARTNSSRNATITFVIVDLQSVKNTDTAREKGYDVHHNALNFLRNLGGIKIEHEGFSEHMTFFLSESGGFYGGYDDYFCLIGNDVESALQNLFFEHDFIQLEQ